MTKPIISEQYMGLINASSSKAQDIDCTPCSLTVGHMQIIELIGAIHAADMSKAVKRSMTDVLAALIEQSQMEERFKILLTKSDMVFLKWLQELHPSLNAREAIVCLFIKLGYDTREIARRNGISQRGMESVRYRIHKKMGGGKHEALKTYLSRML